MSEVAIAVVCTADYMLVKCQNAKWKKIMTISPALARKKTTTHILNEQPAVAECSAV